MKTIHYFLLFTLIQLCSFSVFGQQVIKDTVLNTTEAANIKLSAHHAQAVVLSCSTCDFSGGYLLAEGDTFLLKADPHVEGKVFIHFSTPVDTINIFAEISGELTVYFLNSGTAASPNIPPGRSAANPDCKPEIIPPDVWREGLTAPSSLPAFTDSEHMVIHHSATTNNISDPAQVVRNIYTYHRDVNGWSDIGYNYLIAPDGTIFQGRDDQGMYEPDMIRGAHMCGENSGTMGICMLGTFSQTEPTAEALNSLYRLINWKASKDGIDIFGSALHDIGPPSYNETDRLPFVCGHRDGCRSGYTECPGDQLYALIPQVRDSASVEDCSFPEPEPEEQEPLVFPNPATEVLQTNFKWNFLRVYDVMGRVQYERNFRGQDVSVRTLPPGLYFFHFYLNEGEKIVKKVLVTTE